jgi:hypothetical protein
MKFRKSLIIIVGILTIATLAYAAGIFDRDDQHIRGNWTFHNDALFVDDTYAPFNLPIGAFNVVGTPIQADGTSAPGIATHDSIPKIVWAAAEVTPVQISFWVPPLKGKNATLEFRVFANSDSATTTEIDWQTWINLAATAFDAAAVGQTAVSKTASATNNTLYTLTMNDTAVGQLQNGGFVTLDLWATANSLGTTEISAVQGYYKRK